MQTTKSVIRRSGARSKRPEQIIGVFSNHRCIEIFELLAAYSELCAGQISEKLQIEIRTASEYLRRLAAAGLLVKRSAGREVRHALAERSCGIMGFLENLG